MPTSPESEIHQPSSRILIGMNDAGGGHRRLSEALVDGFRQVNGEKGAVRIEDLFALNPRSWPYRLSLLYGPTIRYLPALYGLIYHATNGHQRVRLLVREGQEPLLNHVRELVRAYQPSVAITTHPLVNGLLLDALESEGLSIPVLAQVSEFVSVHASWIDPRMSAYAVATEEARLAVLGHGAPAASTRVLGLPVGPRFGHVDVPAREIRRRIGLEADRFTVLAVGGGEGAGQLRMAVETLIESGLEIQLVVVCGRNLGLQRRLQAQAAPFAMRVLGYVDSMPELMHAADAVLTKGGPQTMAEAFASGRPVLVTQSLPGQERGNERLVEQHGAGFYVPTPARVVAATARLALDDRVRATMAEAARRLARPNAAVQVAEWALALAEAGEQRAVGA